MFAATKLCFPQLRSLSRTPFSAFAHKNKEGPNSKREPPASAAAAATALHTGERRRKLGSVVVIDDVLEHTNADALEIACVKGWRVVVGMRAYARGDRAVYMEVDTVVPEALLEGRAEHSLLKPKRFVIKTKKIRGEVSQGILFNMDILPEDARATAAVGDDVTDTLGLTLKAAPELPSNCLERLPARVPRTDEERVQNLQGVLRELEGVELYATEKLDGQSFTAFLLDGAFSVASRNWVVTDESDHHKVAAAIGLEGLMRAAGLDNIAIQGELIGPGVQKNRYNKEERSVQFFSVYDVAKEVYVPFPQAEKLVKETLGLPWVPVVLPTFVVGPDTTAQQLVDMAEGRSVLNKNAWREGLVFRAVEEATHPTLGRVSFKAISNKYLLKFE